MSIYTRIFKQRAVYWPPSGQSDAFGRPIQADPIEIKCRWEDNTTEAFDGHGRQIIITSQVYTDRDVIPGGLMKFGLLADVTNPGDPFANPDVSEIKKFDKTPNLRNTKFLRIAHLGLFGGGGSAHGSSYGTR